MSDLRQREGQGVQKAVDEQQKSTMDSTAEPPTRNEREENVQVIITRTYKLVCDSMKCCTLFNV